MATPAPSQARPSQAPAGGAAASRPAGPLRCFKCGGRHLMRDCTAPPAEVEAYRAVRRAEEAAGAAGTAAPGDAAPGAAAAAAAGAKPKRKRKITMEDLKTPLALPDLYAHLVPRFRARRRGRGEGRGSEAADAAALVDIYAEWAARLAPGLPFPLVLDQLEALGRTPAMKVEMRGLREAALGVLDLTKYERGGARDGWLGGAVATATAGEAATDAADGGGGAEDDDGDVDALIALGADEEEEGDELLQLLGEGE